MKICFFGIYNPAYSRNEILLAGLKEAGVEVVECKADWRDAKRYLKLWKSLRELKNNYDFIYVAYPSPVATIVAKLATRKPVVCDAFYSMFDSVVNDRHEISGWHPRAIKLLFTDWLSVLLANIVITDTEAHKKYWSLWWGVESSKIYTVYLGVNDKVFYPIREGLSGANEKIDQEKKDHENFLVHFHGTYIPLQGVEKIIEAARIYAETERENKNDKNIIFRLVGSGAGLEKVQNLAKKYSLKNIEFIAKRVTLAELNAYMGEADAVLGIFGDTLKAQRVIPNKVYEGFAAKKALITMDTPAMREIFSDADVLLVENDPQKIAEAVHVLAEDEVKRSDLALSGYKKVGDYKPLFVAKRLISILEKFRQA